MLMIDTAGGDTPLLDTHLQAVEILRDPSHIRDYTTQEWLAFFGEAGFTATLPEAVAAPHRVLFLDRAHAHAAGARRCHSRYLEHRAR